MNPQRGRFEKAAWIALAVVWLALYYYRAFGPTSRIIDEAATGALATGLNDGLASPAGYYQYNWMTGDLLYGVLLAPVYRFCGASMLWLKLLSSLFVCGGVFLWTYVVRKMWGRSVALLFFVWTAVPPPLLEVNYHHAYALHIESLLFSGLLLWLFTRARRVGPRFWETAAFGFVAGFAVFFTQENIATVAAVATAALLRWRRAALIRLAWPGVPAFAIGYAPHVFSVLLAFNIGDALRNFLSASCLANWRDLLWKVFPQCACYSGFGGPELSLAWIALCLIGVLAVLPRVLIRDGQTGDRDWFAAALLLHLFFFSLAYGSAGDFYKIYWVVDQLRPDDARYVVGVGLTLMALASYFFAARGWSWRQLIAAVFLVAGFANLAQDGFRMRSLAVGFDDIAARRGDDYLFYITLQLEKSWRSPADAMRSVRRLPARWRDEGWVRLGRFLGPSELDQALADPILSDRDKNAVARGAGFAFADDLNRTGEIPETRASGLSQRLPSYSPPLARSFVEGYWRGFLERTCLTDFWSREFCEGAKMAGPLNFRVAVRSNVRATVDFLTLRAPQLTPAEIRAALARTTGWWLGDSAIRVADSNRWLTGAVAADVFAFNTLFLQDQTDDASQSIVRAAIADGVAFRLKDNYLRFHFPAGLFDVRAVARSLAEQGVDFKPTGRRDDDYYLAVQ